MPSVTSPAERLEALFEEMAELAGQRNAIDGRIVEIAAEMERDELCGATGARSVQALVAWKLGTSTANAHNICTVANRIDEFPHCAQGMREGRLSLDQVGVIAGGAGEGSDEHYAQLAAVATVNQLRTAVRLEPRPEPEPRPPLQRSITKNAGEHSTNWRITLPHDEAASFDAALQSHLDALITEWKQDHGADGSSGERPPMPDNVDAFLRLVEAGWDGEATRRPHGQRTTVVVHVDVEKRTGALHLGPLLSAADRQFLTCDATCEVWFERDGRVIGAGRTTRTVNRRLRRALEHRHPTCAVPGCGATRGLHAHHIEHWEDGGRTDLDNLVLLCPYHHRLHHRGGITITGPADALIVTDSFGEHLSSRSLARPPNGPPPDVPPYPGPLGERADWWWYNPFQSKSALPVEVGPSSRSRHRRTSLSRMRAVLFDMDGTLVDSEKLWDVAIQQLYDRFGGELTPEVREMTVGGSAEGVMRIVYTDLGLDLDPDHMAATADWLHEITGELFAAGLPWCDGARELLEALAAAEIPMALVTNTRRELTERALDSIGRHYFTATACGDEVANGKPAPDLYQRGARLLGLDPADCLAIEDSVTGAASAEDAGCPVLVVPNDVEVPVTRRRRHIDSLAGLGVAELREIFAELNAIAGLT